jgi:hypothetical protein
MPPRDAVDGHEQAVDGYEPIVMIFSCSDRDPSDHLGITTNFGDLSFAGHHSDARLFGLFQVSILHNIVHLLFGIAGLALARTAAQARTYLVFGGAIYLVLFVYGLIVGQESAANFVPVNTADDFLHLILGIGMIGLGLALTRDRRGQPAPQADTPVV